jgi:transglutaminase/protease-like cytokinesis protein 3
MQTFLRWPEMHPITGQLSEAENDEFFALGYTIGGMMVFPGNKIDGKWTINQARGMNKWTIADRMDLTLECIRRFYEGGASPLKRSSDMRTSLHSSTTSVGTSSSSSSKTW